MDPRISPTTFLLLETEQDALGHGHRHVHPRRRGQLYHCMPLPARRRSSKHTTQHLGFDIQRAMEGFITHGGTPDGSFDFFKLLNNALFVGKAIAYISQTLVGDTFVVCLPNLSQA